MATLAQRTLLNTIMTELWNHRSQFVYKQRRPMELPNLTYTELLQKLSRGEQIAADCSESITAMCKWAGLKDPNGFGYNGYGNSETMLAHLPHYTNPRLANRGAIVHFGSPDHVAMVKNPSFLLGNPTLWEHGAPGVAIVPLSVERQYHTYPPIFLSINNL